MVVRSLNPYEPPTELDPRLGAHPLTVVGWIVTVIGFLLAATASVGAGLRMHQQLQIFDWWNVEFLQGTGSSLLGIGAFAISSWLLLGLLCRREHNTDGEGALFNRGLILIAIVSMLVRLITECASVWTPFVSSWLLTFSAGTAMGMVLYRVRTVRRSGFLSGT